MEENLFPSQRAIESIDGIEEERRLFYVALTRAKIAATLSYAEMRFKWGKNEFSRPSAFLREIDQQYIESTTEVKEALTSRRSGRFESGDNKESAVEALRKQYDYRHAQKSQPAQRFQQKIQKPTQAPNPNIVSTPPSTFGMKRVATRPVAIPEGASQPQNNSAYSVGDCVEHPKFGKGTISRIENLATDHKLIVAFESFGEKTLLAKFAKLTKT